MLLTTPEKGFRLEVVIKGGSILRRWAVFKPTCACSSGRLLGEIALHAEKLVISLDWRLVEIEDTGTLGLGFVLLCSQRAHCESPFMLFRTYLIVLS